MHLHKAFHDVDAEGMDIFIGADEVGHHHGLHAGGMGGADTGMAVFERQAPGRIDTEAPGFGIPWTSIGAIVAASLAFSLLVLRMLWRSRRQRGSIISATI